MVSDVTLASVAVRVFGRDGILLLRKVAAAGVRAGMAELRRTAPRGEGR